MTIEIAVSQTVSQATNLAIRLPRSMIGLGLIVAVILIVVAAVSARGKARRD